MKPNQILSLFLSDFPRPTELESPSVGQQLIAWISQNWDSLSRSDLTVLLNAADALFGHDMENDWSGGNLAMPLRRMPSVAEPTLLERGDEHGHIPTGRWNQSFPWKT